jgi:hypothetical protein
LCFQGNQPAMVLELCSMSLQTYAREKQSVAVEARSMMALDVAGERERERVGCTCMQI